MDAVTVFNFQDRHEVRTIIDADGHPLFCGKDVCEILGYVNASDAVSKHCRGVAKRYPIVDSLGRTQAARFLTEPDLYRLIVGSQLPAAQEFEKWVFEEVLPTIRKTGAYVLPRSELLNKEVAAREFAALKAVAELCGLEGNAAIVSADNAIRREHGISLLQTLQIELKNPDQKYFFSPTQIAEMLHLSGPREVNKLLEIGGYQVKSGGQWLPTEKGKAHAVLLDTGKRHSSGVMIQQSKWKETVLDVLK